MPGIDAGPSRAAARGDLAAALAGAADLDPPWEPRPREACVCASGKPFRTCCGRKGAKRRPPFGVVLMPGWLPAAHCERFVAHAEAQPGRWLAASGGFEAADERARAFRDPGRVTETVSMGPLKAELNDWLARALREVAEPRFGVDLEYFTSMQLLRYRPGGQYRQHADAYNLDPLTRRWHRIADRDVSLLLYLNDDFEGGEICFVSFNFSYRPRRGDLILFPSHHRYLHEARPVTGGTRYAVVTWATARGTDRVEPRPPENAVFLPADHEREEQP